MFAERVRENLDDEWGMIKVFAKMVLLNITEEQKSYLKNIYSGIMERPIEDLFANVI